MDTVSGSRTNRLNELKAFNVHYRTLRQKNPEILKPTLPHQTKDRRTQRTQQGLHEALIALILERGYEAITVKDIVERANVGRSTFYAHHSGKESLLVDGLGNLREMLFGLQRTALAAPGRSPERRLSFSRALFEHANEYREIHRALAGRHCGTVVTNRLRRVLADLVRSEFAAAPASRGAAVPRSAVIHFVVDALMSMLNWWLEDNARLTPAEVNAIFRRLTLPALAAAGLE